MLGHLSLENGTGEAEEEAANNFARNRLIPQEMFDCFVRAGVFTRDALLSFAKEIAIDPGIVVGRLQKEGYIQFNWHNDLKTKYVIA